MLSVSKGTSVVNPLNAGSLVCVPSAFTSFTVTIAPLLAVANVYVTPLAVSLCSVKTATWASA